MIGKHRRAIKKIHLVKAQTSASALLRHLRPEREQGKKRAWAGLVERYETVQWLMKQGCPH